MKQYLNKLTDTCLKTVQLHTAAIKDFNPEPAIHLWNKTPRRPIHMEQMDMRIEQDNQSDNDSESSMDSYHDSDLNLYMSESDQDLEQDMCQDV